MPGPGRADPAKPADGVKDGPGPPGNGGPTKPSPGPAEAAKTVSQTQPPTQAHVTGAGARHVKEVGGFEILSRLGEGGMGQVFKARQKSLDRLVALKVLTPKLAADAEYVKRFELEAKAAAKLNHPNIVQVIETGRDGVIKFIAFEFIDGASLEGTLKKRGKLPEREALKIVREVGDALRYASEKGLIHRDVKPDNILLTKDGVPKLADLGLAKLQGDSASLTQTGIVMGTPHYMAPEQALGDRDLDVRADLYALGLVLYRCLVGELPWHSDSALAILTKHINEDVPDPRAKVPAVTPAAVTVLRGLTARERNDRYPDAASVVRDIDAILAGEGATGPVKKAGPSGPAVVATLVQPPRTKTGADPAVTASGRRRPTPGKVDVTTAGSGSKRPATARANPDKAASGVRTSSSGARVQRASGLQHSMAISDANEVVGRGAAMPLVLGLVLLALCSGAAVAMLVGGGKKTPPDPGPSTQVSTEVAGTVSSAATRDPSPDTNVASTQVASTGTPPPDTKVPPPDTGASTKIASTQDPQPPPTPEGVRKETIDRVKAASILAARNHQAASQAVQNAIQTCLPIEKPGLEAALKLVVDVGGLATQSGGPEAEQAREPYFRDLEAIRDHAATNDLEKQVSLEASGWLTAWHYLLDLSQGILLGNAPAQQRAQTPPDVKGAEGATSVLSSEPLKAAGTIVLPAAVAFDREKWDEASTTAARAQKVAWTGPTIPYADAAESIVGLSKRMQDNRNKADYTLLDAFEAEGEANPKVPRAAFCRARFLHIVFPGNTGRGDTFVKPVPAALGADIFTVLFNKRAVVLQARIRLTSAREKHADMLELLTAAGREGSVLGAFGFAGRGKVAFYGGKLPNIEDLAALSPPEKDPKGGRHQDVQDVFFNYVEKDGKTTLKAKAVLNRTHEMKHDIDLGRTTPENLSLHLRSTLLGFDSVTFHYRLGG